MLGRSPANHGSQRAVKEILKIIELTSDTGIPLVRISSDGRDGITAEITPRGAAHAALLLVDRSLGSIEGTMLGLTFAGTKPQFTIRNRLDGELVTCYFDEKFEDQIKNALKRRVLVSGMMTTRANGIVPSVTDVESVYVFPDDDTLPTVADIVGIDPELTDGLPAEIWVRRNRERA